MQCRVNLSIFSSCHQPHISTSLLTKALLVNKLSDAAVFPKKNTVNSAGYDLSSAVDAVVQANDKAIVPRKNRVPPVVESNHCHKQSLELRVTLTQYSDTPSAADADTSAENSKVSDHIMGTVAANLIAITAIDTAPPNLVVAEHGDASTTAKTSTSVVPPVPPRRIFGSSKIQSYSLEGTTKADNIIVDIAVFFRDITRSVTSL